MGLTEETLLSYLCAQRLLEPAEIAGGRVGVTDASRRNRNFKVHGANGSYFVKQALPDPAAPDHTLACEAAFYRFCEEDPGCIAVRDLLPRLRRWSGAESVLVLELLQDFQPLDEFAAALSPPGFPPWVGSLIGSSLALLHRACPARDAPLLSPLPRAPPWIFSIHKPGPDFLATVSPGNLQLVKILQREPGLQAELDRLRVEWRCETVIHGDLRADNVLLARRLGEALRIAVVDWEMVQFGDPAWDVGSVLQELLRFWITSMPISRDRTPEQLVALARCPLGSLHPASRGLWDAYRQGRSLERAEEIPFLLRATRYCAARLIHCAYEQSQWAPVLPNEAVMMIQVAYNIFSNPRRAVAPLLGIALDA